jgi:ankyrin repeat protein
MQHTKGMLSSDVRLVDSRNEKGETPLLRAMTTGRQSVIRSLLDEGSDPFVRDKKGSTIFIVLAKYCHLWCMNFMFSTVR